MLSIFIDEPQQDGNRLVALSDQTHDTREAQQTHEARVSSKITIFDTRFSDT